MAGKKLKKLSQDQGYSYNESKIFDHDKAELCYTFYLSNFWPEQCSERIILGEYCLKSQARIIDRIIISHFG